MSEPQVTTTSGAVSGVERDGSPSSAASHMARRQEERTDSSLRDLPNPGRTCGSASATDCPRRNRSVGHPSPTT